MGFIKICYAPPPGNSPTTAGSIFKVLSVFPQQCIGVLSSYTFGPGDIVLFLFQPFHDLCGGLIAWLHVFGIDFGHDIVQSVKADLRVIREC